LSNNVDICFDEDFKSSNNGLVHEKITFHFICNKQLTLEKTTNLVFMLSNLHCRERVVDPEYIKMS
jgi:hypothetical protein